MPSIDVNLKSRCADRFKEPNSSRTLSSFVGLPFFFIFFSSASKHGFSTHFKISRRLNLSNVFKNSPNESILLLFRSKLARCINFDTPLLMNDWEDNRLLEIFKTFKFLNSETSILSSLFPDMSKEMRSVGSFPSNCRLRITRYVNSDLSSLKSVSDQDSKISGMVISELSRYVNGHSGSWSLTNFSRSSLRYFPWAFFPFLLVSSSFS